MADSLIEWTDKVWNPVRGCVKVSPGCKHCYAETFAERFRGVPGHPFEQGFDLRIIPEKLEDPLRWRKPRRIFVNSMSDLFQDGVPDDYIDCVFAVMALAPQHTFQALTKRPERMRAYLSDEKRAHAIRDAVLAWHESQEPSDYALSNRLRDHPLRVADQLNDRLSSPRWPLPNCWLGVSCENQDAADERVRTLAETPAATRFLSLEPLLEHIDVPYLSLLDLVIVGGESGPGARPCDVAWIRSIAAQCRDAQVSCFVKQLGANVRCTRTEWNGFALLDTWVSKEHLSGIPGDGRARLIDRKGGDPSEWPEDLRIREMPEVIR